MRRSVWPAIFLLLVPLIAWGVETTAQRVLTATLERQKDPALKTLARASQFVDVIHVSSRPSCLDVQPPEALATPDPLFSCFPLPLEARELRSVSSLGSTAACTLLSSCRAPDWRAIAMYCRPCAPGNIVLRPAMACRRRSKGKSSFPADSSLPPCWARMSQQWSDSIRGQRQEKSQIL